ncbi:hypothetical protein [Paenimyroides baculatum]|uniref:hypothetical protein n=1 Tax=Paenimyroides baculatum TaxID=2608000 RepID=UPI0016816C77|nr:hypothetical protein [Paenimyroides baculatum]
MELNFNKLLSICLNRYKLAASKILKLFNFILEELRLFYVALTRTRNEVVLLIPQDVSLFAVELLTDNNYLLSEGNCNFKTTHCPYCKTGRLVVRRNRTNGSQF